MHCSLEPNDIPRSPVKSSRGTEREATLERSVYFSDSYFKMHHLCSFAHQINLIHSIKPRSAIEVGLGNGFVSSYLRMAGLEVVTADINKSLNPDICAPLAEVKNYLKEPKDLVICCEVLEHMPLVELDQNLDDLQVLGKQLFLTLPNSYRTWGLSGFCHLPKIGYRMFDFVVDIPWKRQIKGGPHFWEVGYSRECSKKNILKKLRQRYSSVEHGRFVLNPYHIWFKCK